jgi:7-cyano-7-deazaguanine synthase in queuosine biosynthesis
MAKDLAIVLNNGSVNAAVSTALAAQKYRVVLAFAEAGPHPGPRARAAYEQQVAHFKPYREHTLPMPFLAGLSGSAPAQAAAAVDPRAPAVVTPRLVDLVPLVAVAARLAVHYSAAAVHSGLRVGPGADDLAQATEYHQIWQELLQMTCGQPDLDVSAPLLELEPWQVVDLGVNVAAPFDRTWSCSEEGPEPCWACRGCRAREAAFQQAAKPDPLRTTRRP